MGLRYVPSKGTLTEMTTAKRIVFLIVLLCLLCPLPRAFALTDILNIRHWAAPDNTRIVIDTSEEAETTISKADQKIIIDFKNAQAVPDVSTDDFFSKPGVERILVRSLSENTLRIEVWLAGYVETRVFKLKAFADKPYRVVIDIGLPEVEKKEGEERKQVKTVIKDKVIVVDPGHGGDDPGAIGRRGTKEKDVVLNISRRLEKILNKKKGYKAFLTRRGDYYPSFNKRLQVAREYGADLFVSIHADAVRNRAIKGSSVYCLSTTGASSVAARLLASQENLADFIGGTENDQGNDETDPIILHMVQTETLNVSKNLANAILDRIRPLNPLKFDQVQFAPFRVLKMPEIPSVLIETAYISNPREERLLRSTSFQKKIAKAIAASVDQVLSNGKESPETIIATKKNPKKTDSTSVTPEVQTKVKTENKEEVKLEDKEKVEEKVRDEAESKVANEAKMEKTVIYKVRKGDTLEKIARRHDTTIAELLKLNQIKINKPLYVNKRLKVPTGKTPKDREEAPTEKNAVYRVKRGDTIEKIAKKHDITMAALLKANGMKRNDLLYVNRKLIIP